MTVAGTTKTHPTTSGRGLAAVLLARRGSVYLPAAEVAPGVPDAHDAHGAGRSAGVTLLEADLLDRGYLLSARLRAGLAARSATALATAGRELLAEIDHELGADRPHLPLFRDFPRSTPQDTLAFYVDRVLTVLFQYPEQPCVLCGAQGSVHAASPCAHLVCRSCFDGAMDDQRQPLPHAVVEQAVHTLTGEILRRAATAPSVDLAVVDAVLTVLTVLTGLIAPFAQRTASRSLVSLPRGSELPVPEGTTLRLFLHWMESDTSGRVDLDLSLAMFDAEWKHIGTCDYTQLRFADAAVHSGDLTSAPPPLGATEFADLDLERLAAAGASYAVAVAFSYNNVAFEELAEGFAGLMVREAPGNDGSVFDPRAVEQRFDRSAWANSPSGRPRPVPPPSWSGTPTARPAAVGVAPRRAFRPSRPGSTPSSPVPMPMPL